MNVLEHLVELDRKLLAKGCFPVEGFADKRIGYVVVLDDDTGSVVEVIDHTERKGPAMGGKLFNVPQEVKRTMNVLPNTLWDNTKYVFGAHQEPDPAKRDAKKVAGEHALNALRQASFASRVAEIAAAYPHNIGFRAMKQFLTTVDPASFDSDTRFSVITQRSCNIAFMLLSEWRGGKALICQHTDVVGLIAADDDTSGETDGERQCSVTGSTDRILRLHGKIKGVEGAQSSGANLVSCNTASVQFHGLKQGAVAAVGVAAGTAYVRALNYLLAKPEHRICDGDLTHVIWSEGDARGEAFLADLFDDPRETDPQPEAAAEAVGGGTAVADIIAAVRSGVMPVAPVDTFYMLSLGANSSRLYIKGWHAGTMEGLYKQAADWFNDLAIDGAPAGFSPKIRRLLRALVPTIDGREDLDRLSPAMKSNIFAASTRGDRIDPAVIRLAVSRLRVETDFYKRFALTSILKVALRRSNNPVDFTMSLNPNETNVGYCLGRLFAVLNKVQSDSSPHVRKTVRDRMWSAFSANPAIHFNSLMSNCNHHLTKLNGGRKVVLSRALSDAVANLPPIIPARLSLADQAAFAIGFHHQDSSFYTKKNLEPINSVDEDELIS